MPRLYHLIVRTVSAQPVYLTRYPMTHAQCCVMKSKQSARTINRVEFLPV